MGSIPTTATKFSLPNSPKQASNKHAGPDAHDYNELIPPSNPDYPWVPKDWQPLCYYCNQPICQSKPWAGFRQRVIWNWEHVNPSKSEGWTKGSTWHCDPARVRPTEEIDDPRCHGCETQEAEKHGMICSKVGKPPFHATPLSTKEEELRRRFGWHPKFEEEEKKRVSAMGAIGVLTITGVIIGLFAWLGKAR